MTMTRDYTDEFAVYSRTVENRRTVYYRGMRWSATVHHRTSIVMPHGTTTMTTTWRHAHAIRTDRMGNQFYYIDSSKGMHFRRESQTLGIDVEFQYEAMAHAAMIPDDVIAPF